MDPDELDDEEQLSQTTIRGHMDQSMPLIVGLFDSSASRRSVDSPFPLSQSNGHAVLIGEDTVDLEELAAKRTAGGGMLDSIANMANSILGAGKR